MLLGPWGLLSHGGAAVAWCRISYLNETFNVYFGVRVLGLSHLFACPNNKDRQNDSDKVHDIVKLQYAPQGAHVPAC